MPETLGSFLGGPGAEPVPGPSWFHNGRIVLGPLWAVALAVVAVAVPTTLPWWQAVMAGGAGATVTGITMPLVLR